MSGRSFVDVDVRRLRPVGTDEEREIERRVEAVLVSRRGRDVGRPDETCGLRPGVEAEGSADGREFGLGDVIIDDCEVGQS